LLASILIRDIGSVALPPSPSRSGSIVLMSMCYVYAQYAMFDHTIRTTIRATILHIVCCHILDTIKYILQKNIHILQKMLYNCA
jgi:hypothetical protein